MSSVGIDVGGTKCLAVVLSGGRVVAEGRRLTPDGGAEILDAVAALAREVAEGHHVESVGAGLPGLVDREGVLRFAPNLPGVVDLDVAGGLGRRLGLAVRVDNDATCATWGERQMGAARGVDHVVLVTLGTGIGGGMVVDGNLARGAHGFAGEVGHMVVDPLGPECPCGRRGCWERFASGTGLARLAREAAAAGEASRVLELAGGDGDAISGEHVTSAAAEGDTEASAVLGRFGWWVAVGLANLASLLDPDVFVLGGGLVEAGELLARPVRDAFGALLLARDHRPPVRIVTAELGERAGAVGAACLGAGELLPYLHEKAREI